MAKRKTLVDIADHGAENFVCIQAERKGRRTANKAIHAARGPQLAVWDKVAAHTTKVAFQNCNKCEPRRMLLPQTTPCK